VLDPVSLPGAVRVADPDDSRLSRFHALRARGHASDPRHFIVESELAVERVLDSEFEVLSVLGTDTQTLWVEVADFLRSSLPHVEDCVIDGAGHLLHIQRPAPVARALAKFLQRNSLTGE